MIGFTSELYENKTEVPVYELEEGKDMLCLGDGLIFPARDKSVNSNTIVVGSTRSGKTVSIILPTIFHSYQR